jgi:gliding motility-associated-like protein
MKIILSLLFIVVGISFSYSQFNITDSDYDQSNPADCSTLTDADALNFLDDGGNPGNYSGNFNDTLTICPDLPNGPKLSVLFGTTTNFVWDVDGSDTLYVFDGPDVNSPLFGAYNSDTHPTGFNLQSSFENNPSGCLTFVFVSDGTTEAEGWAANITCVSPPQPIDPHIEAFINGVGSDALNPADTGYVDVCPGDSVLLVAKPELQYSFENTGYGYSQDVDDLTYQWDFTDGTTGPNNDSVWFFPQSSNGFLAQLTITDDYPQTVFMTCKVRVSVPPNFDGTGPLEDTVCFDQETVLLGGTNGQDTVGVGFPGGTFQFGGVVSGSTPLPDGSGVSYSTDITMSGFSPGSTFSSATDLQEICIDIEHSYLGDLDIILICPNGQQLVLHQYPGGGGTFLGNPWDGAQQANGAGDGLTYCFDNNATGLLVNGPTQAATNTAGNTIQPGTYEPEGDFNDLVGCPLNGDWTLEITDNLGSDDGYIFEWGLNFDPSLFLNNETYQNYLVDSYWSSDPTITSGVNNDTLITVLPDSVGDFYYTFNVEDDFGCFYDTTVMIHVLDTIATVNSLDTTVLCATDSVPLWTTASGLEPFTYTWSTGETGDTIVVPAFDDGTTEYYVTITDACGVETIDTASVTLNQILAIDTMIQIPSECGEATGAVSGQGSGFTGTPDYQWSGPGSPANDSIGASVWEDLPTGWYYFTIEDDVCFVEDSIFLEQDPPPTAAFTANPPAGNSPLDVEFINNSDAADTYEWDFGNGDGNVVNNLSNQYTTYNTEGVYTVTLTVTEGSCTDQATQNVIVTLLLPLSYDMPNVFTPNNDGSNDVFTLNTVNATDLKLVILNRWGNVVYESEGDIDAAWNGKVQNVGQECNDGTYFYQFTIYGEQLEKIEEHGFVQLVRDTSEK